MLDKIMGAVGDAGKGFLSGVMGPIASGLGGQIAQGLFGRKNRLSGKDAAHYQNLMDKHNTRELSRQQEFLTGITPTEAGAHNTYQDLTYGEDTRRFMERQNQLVPQQAQLDKQYMDTVYEGTSAWERLGSSAAPSLQAPNPETSPKSQGQNPAGFLSSLTPLATAEIQADAAKTNALIQADTQRDVAKIQQETQLATTAQQTNDGKLPQAQTAVAAAEELLKLEQADETSAKTQQVKMQTLNSTLATMFANLPKRMIDLGIMKYEDRPGFREIFQLFNSDLGIGYPDFKAKIDEVTSKLPKDQFSQFERDAMQIASLVAKGARTLATTAMDSRTFLRTLGR